MPGHHRRISTLSASLVAVGRLVGRDVRQEQEGVAHGALGLLGPGVQGRAPRRRAHGSRLGQRRGTRLVTASLGLDPPRRESSFTSARSVSCGRAGPVGRVERRLTASTSAGSTPRRPSACFTAARSRPHQSDVDHVGANGSVQGLCRRPPPIPSRPPAVSVRRPQWCATACESLWRPRRGGRAQLHRRPRRGGGHPRAQRGRQDLDHRDARGLSAHRAPDTCGSSASTRSPSPVTRRHASASCSSAAASIRCSGRVGCSQLFAAYYPDREPPDELLDLLGLGPVADVAWRHLSGGEQQRVSLALALIGRPEVVFLDEPTVGRGPRGANRLSARCWTTCAGTGICVVLTTHELARGRELADRVLIVDRRPGGGGGLAGRAGGIARRSSEPRFGTDARARHRRPGGGPRRRRSTELGAGRYEIGGAASAELTAALATWLAERGAVLTNLRPPSRSRTSIWPWSARTRRPPKLASGDGGAGDEDRWQPRSGWRPA